MELNNLGRVQEEIFEARTKWYDIGLQLNVQVHTLDSIKSQFSDPKDCLREILKVWLKTAGKTTWKTLVDALMSRTIEESQLAARLKEKYCVAALVNENEEQACPTQDLNQQVKGLHTEIQQLKQELLEARAQNLQEESDTARQSDSEIQHLRQELKTRDQQLQEKDQLLEASQHEIQQLKQQLLEAQNPQEENDAAKQSHSEIQHLRQESETRDQQLQQKDQLQAALEASQQEIQQLRQKVAQQDHQVQESQAKTFKAQQALDQTEEVRQSEIQQLRHKLEELDCQVQETKENIKARQCEIQQFKQKLESRDQQLKAKDHEIQEKDEALAAKQKEIEKLRLELHAEEDEKSPATKKRRKFEDLHLQSREQSQAEATSEIQETFTCKELLKVPLELNGVSSAVIDGKMAYFGNNINMYAYDLDKMGWSVLPACPHKYFSLAVVNGQLTTIGGKNVTTDESTNSLLSLTRKSIGRTWSEQFLPMPTARIEPAVACNAKALIVAGGQYARRSTWGCSEYIHTTVEVMDTGTKQWFTLSRHLQDYSNWCTIAIAKDILYIYYTTINDRKQTIACSITDLLQLGSSQDIKWYNITSILAAKPTIATIKGKLVAISDKDNTEIHLYDHENDSWEVIGNVPTAISTLVVNFSGNGLIIVDRSKTRIIIPDFE